MLEVDLLVNVNGFVKELVVARDVPDLSGPIYPFSFAVLPKFSHGKPDIRHVTFSADSLIDFQCSKNQLP